MLALQYFKQKSCLYVEKFNIHVSLRLLVGDQKNTGLMLKKDAFTVIIPYKQNIEISFKDGKTVKNGILFNASLNTIWPKSLSSDETISIPSNREVPI